MDGNNMISKYSNSRESIKNWTEFHLKIGLKPTVKKTQLIIQSTINPIMGYPIENPSNDHQNRK